MPKFEITETYLERRIREAQWALQRETDPERVDHARRSLGEARAALRKFEAERDAFNASGRFPAVRVAYNFRPMAQE